MNYQNKNVAITGAGGFLGSAISLALANAGANVTALTGDIRDRDTFEPLDYSFDYLFHFAGPSSQILFKRQPLTAIDTSYCGFKNALEACHRNAIKLIYPSTGLLSSPLQQNEYSRSKQLMEDIHLSGGFDALGLRIFATYGPQEGHKRDYASVPYIFARAMQAGRSPVIWGDGSQRRDFIYIDDVVQAVLILAEEATKPIIDVGSGISTSFNQLLQDLSENFKMHGHHSSGPPVFVDKPAGYVDETACDTTILHKYFIPEADTADGTYKLVGKMINQ